MYEMDNSPEICVFRFREEINSYYEEFGDKIEDIVSEIASRSIMLDFSKLHYINSATIGIIVRFVKHLRKAGFKFASCSMDEHIHNVFRITSLLDFLVYRESRETALEHLRG